MVSLPARFQAEPEANALGLQPLTFMAKGALSQGTSNAAMDTPHFRLFAYLMELFFWKAALVL